MIRAVLPLAVSLAPAPALAAEVFAGVYAHDTRAPLTHGIGEGGTDFEFGVRGAPIRALHELWSPAPYLVGSVNSRGDTSFVAAGLSWRFGSILYLRPGVGLSAHTGPSRRYARGRRTDLGSRVTFEPELGAGVRVSPRWALEASVTHLSHGWLFSSHNPGVDMIGVRVNWRR